MILVIDAYNVLKSGGSSVYIQEADRERFIKLLGKYGKRKGHTIVAVFDGGHTVNPYRESVHGVTVVYSGIRESADVYIKQYVQDNRNRDLMLISSDRELAHLASRLGIISMNAVEFYQLLREETAQVNAPAIETRAIKTTESELPELDELMRSVGSPRTKLADREMETQDKKSKAQVLSKKERAMMKKIKKL